MVIYNIYILAYSFTRVYIMTAIVLYESQ